MTRGQHVHATAPLIGRSDLHNQRRACAGRLFAAKRLQRRCREADWALTCPTQTPRDVRVRNRTIKVVLLIFGGSLILALILAGPYALRLIRMSSYDSPGDFMLARAHPEFGDGSPAAVSGGRLLIDDGRTLQVLVQMGDCDALSSLSVTESATRVVVTARSVSLPGACTASTKLVFANAFLNRPLAGRVLVDGRSGRRLGVEVCQSGKRLQFDGLCYPGRYGVG